MEIRPSQKYGEADLVAYALNVADSIDFTVAEKMVQ